MVATSVTGSLMSNPLDPAACQEIHRMETLPARTIFHELQALIRPLAGHVQTQEELDLARDKICGIQ